ncbi:MAG: hypothetical protein V1776_03840 [Candidatus Diapherotrites archaeon]
MECTYIKEDGNMCQAQAILSDVYCFAHSQLPEMVEKRHLAKVEGGRNGRKVVLEPAEDSVAIKSVKDVVALLEQTVNDVRQNRVTINHANCIGFLCGITVKAMEKVPPADDENRITVEDIVKRLRVPEEN